MKFRIGQLFSMGFPIFHTVRQLAYLSSSQKTILASPSLVETTKSFYKFLDGTEKINKRRKTLLLLKYGESVYYNIRENGLDYVRKEGSREGKKEKVESENWETKRSKEQRAVGLCREEQLGEVQPNTVPVLESSG